MCPISASVRVKLKRVGILILWVFMLCPLNEQIPDWCEATLADDSHAVFGCHDLADFFQLRLCHDDSLVFAEGWVVEQEGFEFFANGFSPTAFVRAEAVVLKR